MKLETDLKGVSFEPIRIFITIESTSELCELFTRFNVNIKEPLEKYTKGTRQDQFDKVFDLLLAEIKRLSLNR